MNELCKNIERKLLLDEPLTTEEHRHVLHCGSCQKFASLHGMLTQPSGELDKRVLKSVNAVLSERRRANLRHRLFRVCSWAGAAAVLMTAVVWVARVKTQAMPSNIAHTTSHEEILLLYEDASEELDAIEYRLASSRPIYP